MITFNLAQFTQHFSFCAPRRCDLGTHELSHSVSRSLDVYCLSSWISLFSYWEPRLPFITNFPTLRKFSKDVSLPSHGINSNVAVLHTEKINIKSRPSSGSMLFMKIVLRVHLDSVIWIYFPLRSLMDKIFHSLCRCGEKSPINTKAPPRHNLRCLSDDSESLSFVFLSATRYGSMSRGVARQSH